MARKATNPASPARASQQPDSQLLSLCQDQHQRQHSCQRPCQHLHRCLRAHAHTEACTGTNHYVSTCASAHTHTSVRVCASASNCSRACVNVTNGWRGSWQLLLLSGGRGTAYADWHRRTEAEVPRLCPCGTSIGTRTHARARAHLPPEPPALAGIKLWSRAMEKWPRCRVQPPAARTPP